MKLIFALIVLSSIFGCNGCGRGSTPTTTARPPTTTTRKPVVEDGIVPVSAGNQQAGNAWFSGSGIDWSQGNNRGQTGNVPNRSPAQSNTPNRSNRPPSGGSRPLQPVRVTPNDLRRLSEDIFQADSNSVGNQVTINPQGRTSSSRQGDQASQKLFGSVPQSVFRGETIAPFYALLNNYEASVTKAETDTNEEKREQEEFLNAVMATPVMAKTERFLTEKGYINRPLRDVLKELWFTPYTRSRRVVGSSGFEHVFVGEIKNGQVSGFHNWMSFYKEEQEGDLDYLGHMKTIDLGDKGKIILLKFLWTNEEKPVGSMLVGTSPELEMALFTVCFLTRQGNNCPVSLNGQRFNIKTQPYDYQGKKLIGTAYPNI